MDDDDSVANAPVDPGDSVHLQSVLGNFTFHGVVADSNPPPVMTIVQGPPGPMLDLSEMPIPGTVPEAAVSFVVDGWEYRFPSIHHARLVREKLTSMTLEGEL